jgi:hypothetical protein
MAEEFIDHIIEIKTSIATIVEKQDTLDGNVNKALKILQGNGGVGLIEEVHDNTSFRTEAFTKRNLVKKAIYSTFAAWALVLIGGVTFFLKIMGTF